MKESCVGPPSPANGASQNVLVIILCPNQLSDEIICLGKKLLKICASKYLIFNPVFSSIQ
jgi:hypothetical protein